jgi:hypothetical protein
MLISREGVINHIIELEYTFYENVDDDFILFYFILLYFIVFYFILFY